MEETEEDMDEPDKLLCNHRHGTPSERHWKRAGRWTLEMLVRFERGLRCGGLGGLALRGRLDEG